MKFLYILLALVILLVLITVHELGHFVAGKVFGFKINEFAIGFGPKLYSRTNKKTGEVFSIRALPLGGLRVRMMKIQAKTHSIIKRHGSESLFLFRAFCLTLFLAL